MNDDRAFGEVKAKVEALQDSFLDFRAEIRASLAEMNASLKERLDLDSARLGRLERWRAFIAGSLAALATLWALIKGVLPVFWTPRP